MAIQFMYPYCDVCFTSGLSCEKLANRISDYVLNGVPMSESYTVLEAPGLAIRGTFLGMKIRINEIADSTFGFSLDCRRLDLMPTYGKDEIDLDITLSESASEKDLFPFRANLSSYIAALLDEIEGIDVVWTENLQRPSA